MAKVKLTKGELKTRRDALRQFRRYLPTLQLKKQQLQMEILHRSSELEAKRKLEREKHLNAEFWAGLLTDASFDPAPFARPLRVITRTGNIAGVDFPVFESAEYKEADYDLFATPIWADHAVDALREINSIRSGIKVLEDEVGALRRELRIATQRVNLFEKVKIPEAEEAIRRIKIYVGDQMTNSVGRSKIAKRKIEEAVVAEMPV